MKLRNPATSAPSRRNETITATGDGWTATFPMDTSGIAPHETRAHARAFESAVADGCRITITTDNAVTAMPSTTEISRAIAEHRAKLTRSGAGPSAKYA